MRKLELCTIIFIRIYKVKVQEFQFNKYLNSYHIIDRKYECIDWFS